MKAQVFDIISRDKPVPFEIASGGDFKLEAAGECDAQTILHDPNIMLYCLEHENQQAVFVEVPEAVDVLAAPFYYIGQFQRATKVLKISFEVLEILANQVELDDRRLIFLYSMGRSGTTLTSSAFSCAEGVVSLSEPDVFTQLVQMSDFSGSNDAEIEQLIKICLLMTCKDRIVGEAPVWQIKFRSFVVEIADKLYQHFPSAKSLFLYRRLDPWVKSTARAFGGSAYPAQEVLIGYWMWSKEVVRNLAQYHLENVEEINAGLLVSLMWLNNMECCLANLEAGHPMLPVRYEDLKEEPQQVMNEIFEYCGVRLTDKLSLIDVFQQDSQAKTPVSREQLQQVDWELTADDMAVIHRVISEQPVINSPDFELPGTLKLS